MTAIIQHDRVAGDYDDLKVGFISSLQA